MPDLASTTASATARSSKPSKPDAGGAIRYRLRHSTSYRYGSEIPLAHHLLHLKPRPVGHQAVAEFRLTIEPPPAVTSEHDDSFGNPVTYVAIQTPHSRLTVHAEAEITVSPPAIPPLTKTPDWTRLVERLTSAEDPDARTATAFAFPSSMIPLMPELLDYTAADFPDGRPIAAAAAALMHRVHKDFTFDATATTIATPLATLFAERRGVCQDFAHLMIACLRTRGLAARYVSGYLRTLPPPGRPRLIGADASHAWASVWCGGEDWLDLDPTNDRLGSTDLLTIAWGRDFQDVSPVSGVFRGGRDQTLSVAVDVEPIAGVGGVVRSDI